MAQNCYIQPGEVLDFTAPVGGVVAYEPVLIGSQFVIPLITAAAGASFAGQVTGVWNLAKPAGVFAHGAVAYWDNGAKQITTTALGNRKVGTIARVTANGDAKVWVRLDAVATEEATEAAAGAAVAAAVAVTNGGAGNAGKLLKADANGKIAGRVLETDGPALDGLTTGAAQAIRKDGTVAMGAALAMGGQKITGLADGVAATDAVTMQQLSAAVAGLLDFKGDLDCAANPNYPAALKGDAYVCSVAGKVGGAGGVDVDVGDMIVCKADAAAGDQAAVGASWLVLEHNLAGALLASALDPDATMAADSDAKIATQKAVKAALALKASSTQGARADSIKACTVAIAAGAENGTLAAPAGWANGDKCIATLAGQPTNPVAVKHCEVAGGFVTVTTGALNGGANGQPGGAGVNATVVRVQDL